MMIMVYLDADLLKILMEVDRDLERDHSKVDHRILLSLILFSYLNIRMRVHCFR